MSSPAGLLRRLVPTLASGVVLVLVACSSDSNQGTGTGSTSSAVCEDAKCAPGNKCLPLNGEVKCRRVCSSQSDPATSCPAGYACVPQVDTEAFCVKNTFELAPRPGQWGTPCSPAKGLEANTDCDVEGGFYCFGTSPFDAEAYCTRYECETDLDCGAGFFCGSANIAPNVTTAKRAYGETVKICQRRAYCAPCTSDFQCPDVGGTKQHCFRDDDGNGFCTPECTSSGSCTKDAQCVSNGEFNGCYPRAGRCVGQGELCSPCRSDADCPDGACVRGSYTTETHCAVKAPTAQCGEDENNGKGCPAAVGPKSRAVRCLGGIYFEDVPPQYCHGVYALGEGGDVGCWTPNR